MINLLPLHIESIFITVRTGVIPYLQFLSMKVLLCLVVIVFPFIVSSQEWRDSLRVARNSYIQGNFEKSFFQYGAAQKLAPAYIDLSSETAQAVYHLGKYELAEKIYKRSSSLNGSSKEKAELYRQIGNSQMHQSKYKEAIESYKISLRNNSEDGATRYNLAEAIRKLKEKQQPDKDKSKPQSPSKSPQKDPNEQPYDHKQQPQNTTPQNEGRSVKMKQSEEMDPKRAQQLLAELTKKELETKQKIEKRFGSKVNSVTSGKDW